MKDASNVSPDLADPLEGTRRVLLDEILNQFGVTLPPGHMLNCYRDDVSVHPFVSGYGWKPAEETWQEIRHWVESKDWQLSRQVEKIPVPDLSIEIENVYLAPMIPVGLDRGYHATRSVSVPSIRTTGLLPSTHQRQTTTDRRDCEGNIYVCEALGTPADAGVPGSKTAHWWRDELARTNRFNDPDWVILEIDVRKVHGARLYKDIFSDSGIIVGGVHAIPPGAIQPGELHEPSTCGVGQKFPPQAKNAAACLLPFGRLPGG